MNCYIEITDFCNYNCDFCCKSWRKNNIGNITEEHLNKILNYDFKFYLITGGEPACNKEIFFNFINKIKNKKYTLNTNLSLWTKKDLDIILKSSVREINIDFPSIIQDEYLDITKASLNNYKTVIENIKYLSQIDTSKINIVIVIINKNISSYKQTILFFSSYFGIKNFTVSLAIGKEKKYEKDFYNNLFDFIKNHANLNIKTLSKTKNTGNVPTTHICDAGIGHFVILTNGDAVPCAWNNDTVLGNIFVNNIEDLIKNGRKYFNNFSNEEKFICKGYLNKC